MAQNLVTSLSFVKSNVFSCARFISPVRYFHPFQFSSHRLRWNKHPVPQLKLSSFKPRIACNFMRIRKNHSKAFFEIDTNISNNLLLWKYKNPKYFRNLKIFAFMQLLVFGGFSYVVHLYLPSVDKYDTYKNYIKDNGLLLITIYMPILTVILTSLIIWLFETRSLKYIILNKGGKMVSLVSFHPINGSKTIVTPLESIIVTKSRYDTGAYMSLKVRGTRLYYLIDKEGIFVNPEIFDASVGAFRK